MQDINRFNFLKPFGDGLMTWTSSNGNKNSISISTIFNDSGQPEYLRLYYTWHRGDGDIKKNYSIWLSATKCFFGGKRYWFLCKLCNKRVGVLYMDNGLFSCRYCLDLGYDSQYQYYGPSTRCLKRLGKAWDAEEKMGKLRIKFWLGNPTRRYRQLLSKCNMSLEEMHRLKTVIRN